MTTRNNDVGTVAERRSARGEPDSNTTDLVSATKTTKRVGAGPLGEQVRVGVKVSGGHTGTDVAGEMQLTRISLGPHSAAKLRPI